MTDFGFLFLEAGAKSQFYLAASLHWDLGPCVSQRETASQKRERERKKEGREKKKEKEREH